LIALLKFYVALLSTWVSIS